MLEDRLSPLRLWLRLRVWSNCGERLVYAALRERDELACCRFTESTATVRRKSVVGGSGGLVTGSRGRCGTVAFGVVCV